jgi:hypothetical protein
MERKRYEVHKDITSKTFMGFVDDPIHIFFNPHLSLVGRY